MSALPSARTRLLLAVGALLLVAAFPPAAAPAPGDPLRVVKNAAGKPLVSVPKAWRIDRFATKDFALVVIASPDPDGWRRVLSASYETGAKAMSADWTIPGVVVLVSPKIAKKIKTAGADSLAASVKLAQWHGASDSHPGCKIRIGANLYDNHHVSGFESLYKNCGGRGAKLYDAGVIPGSGTPVLQAIGSAVSKNDDAIVRRILASLG